MAAAQRAASACEPAASVIVAPPRSRKSKACARELAPAPAAASTTEAPSMQATRRGAGAPPGSGCA